MSGARVTPWGRLGSYAALCLLVLLAIGPFLWLLSTAFKGPAENLFIYPPQWLPEAPTLANFLTVWQRLPFMLFLGNSLGVAALCVVLNLSLSVLAAYPLARMRFTGSRLVLLLILGTLMVPFQVLMIPLYLQMQQLGLTENNGFLASWLGLALPFAVSGFGMFYMRQAMLAIPRDFEEAATLDGASSWQTLVHVFLPLLRPALATLGLFTLMACWGEFLWPSLLVQTPQFMTLPVGLIQLQGQFSSDWRAIAAGTLMAMAPTLILFLSLQSLLRPSSWSEGSKG